MSRLPGAVGIVAVLVLVLAFARLNENSWVTVELGIVTLHRVPVTYVAFAGLFVGMLVMFVAGLHADLRVRRFLRERLEAQDQEERERIDRYQRDLFQSDPE